MAPERVDPIDWSNPPPSWAAPPELHVLHGVNAAYKSQDLLDQPGIERASTGMPVQRTTCAATQGINRLPSTDPEWPQTSINFQLVTGVVTDFHQL